MKETVVRAGRGLPLSFEEVDISVDSKLEKRYLLEIPVLFINDELAFRHRVDEKTLRARLQDASGP